MKVDNRIKYYVTDKVINYFWQKELETDSLAISTKEINQRFDDMLTEYELAIKRQCFEKYFKLGYERAMREHGIISG